MFWKVADTWKMHGEKEFGQVNIHHDEYVSSMPLVTLDINHILYEF